ncbi:hypothetical protein H1R20_g8539, partial [Candolleomyces eurysporus]
MASVQTTNAAVLYPGTGRELRVEERPLWPPKPHEAQIQVLATGLCGSDLHYYSHGRNGDFQVRQPLVLGHEAAGIVTAIGSGVTHLRVGQRVAIEAGIYCRQCSYCQKQRLPDSCSFEQASLAEPLSVLIHASRRANLAAGQTVLVFGVGTIGLLACALAKARGASKVVAVDINPSRLEFAKTHGFASQTFCLPSSSSSPSSSHSCSHSQPQSRPQATPQQLSAEKRKEIDDQMRRLKDNMSSILNEFGQKDGFDLVYECTGAEMAIQMSVFGACTGGKVMLIGMGSRNVMMPLSSAACREVDILGSFRYCDTYPDALALLASGELDGVDNLVTHRFGLDDTKKAFEMMAKGVDDDGNMVLKVMVGPGSAA